MGGLSLILFPQSHNQLVTNIVAVTMNQREHQRGCVEDIRLGKIVQQTCTNEATHY